MLLKESFHSVKRFVKDLNIGQINEADMALAEFWRKTNSMNEEDMIYVE